MILYLISLYSKRSQNASLSIHGTKVSNRMLYMFTFNLAYQFSKEFWNGIRELDRWKRLKSGINGPEWRKKFYVYIFIKDIVLSWSQPG